MNIVQGYKLKEAVIIDHEGNFWNTKTGDYYNLGEKSINSIKEENLNKEIINKLIELDLICKIENRIDKNENRIDKKESMIRGIFNFPHLDFSDFYKSSKIDVAIIGIPYDLGSVTIPGTRLGAEVLRTNSWEINWEINDDLSISGFFDYEKKKNLINNLKIVDIGNIGDHLSLNKNKVNSLSTIEYFASLMFNKKLLPIFIGGDHSITAPIINSLPYDKINILHFDAHSDLTYEKDISYENLVNNNVISYVKDLHKVNKIFSIGLRDATKIDGGPKIFQYSVETIKECRVYDLDQINDDIPIYITIDVDVLDPIYLSNTGSLVPGGVSDYQLIKFLTKLFKVNSNVVGIDLVELNSDSLRNDKSGVLLTNILIRLISEIVEGE